LRDVDNCAFGFQAAPTGVPIDYHSNPEDLVLVAFNAG
jgi:hypothetical protein